MISPEEALLGADSDGMPLAAGGPEGVGGEHLYMGMAIVVLLAGAAAFGAGAYGRAHPENKAPVIAIGLLVMALGWYLATQGI